MMVSIISTIKRDFVEKWNVKILKSFRYSNDHEHEHDNKIATRYRAKCIILAVNHHDDGVLIPINYPILQSIDISIDQYHVIFPFLSNRLSWRKRKS
jgi:hypothetical protein